MSKGLTSGDQDTKFVIYLPGPGTGETREARGIVSGGIKRALGSVKHHTDPYRLEYLPSGGEGHSGDPVYIILLSDERGEVDLMYRSLNEAALLHRLHLPYSSDLSEAVKKLKKLKDAGIYEAFLESLWKPWQIIADENEFYGVEEWEGSDKCH